MTARATDHRRPVFGEGVARWPYRILAVDSTTGPASSVPADFLLDAGIEISPFADGASALICMSSEDPAAILVPTEMLGVDFTYFVETVTQLCSVPVIVGLTNEPGSQERAYQALEIGARALTVLPAGLEQLTSLTQQLGVRRSGFVTRSQHALVAIDPEAHRVEVDGKAVHLSAVELGALKVLVEAAPHVVLNQEFVRLLSANRPMTLDNLKRVISRVRVKLAAAAPDQPDLIETVRSLGYRLRS